MYSGSRDRTIRVRDGSNGAALARLRHTHAVSAIVVVGDGTIISGARDKTIRVWSGRDRTCINILQGHTNSIFTLAVGKDGRLFSGSGDKTVRVWNVKTGKELHTLNTKFDVDCLAVGEDGRMYCGGRDDASIRLW